MIRPYFDLGTTAAGALTALPLVAHAGLMDSLTDTVTSSVTSTAKEMAGNAMDTASNEAIKKALDIKEGGSNKQAIKDKLGAPASTKTDAGLEVWTYDLDALNKASPLLAETTKSLLKDSEEIGRASCRERVSSPV